MSRPNAFGGWLLILIGGLFLLHTLDILSFGWAIARFWPLILIAIGVRLVIDRSRKSHARSGGTDAAPPAAPPPPPDAAV